MTGSSNDDYNFPYKLSKTQLHQIGQSGGFLGRPSRPLLKNGVF